MAFVAAQAGSVVGGYSSSGLLELTPQQTNGPDRILLYADDPEQVPGPGIIYRDTISNRPVRIVGESVNASGGALQNAVLVEAVTSVTVREQRSGAGLNGDAFASGSQAVYSWLRPIASQWTLGAGGTRLLVWTPAAAPGQVWTVLYDFVLSGTARLSVLAFDPQNSAAPLVLLPGQSGEQHPYRGTFHGADIGWTVGQVRDGTMLRLATAAVPGYLMGQAVGLPGVNGNVQVPLIGNYGVAYMVTVQFAGPVAMGIAPTAGGFAGAVGIGGLRVPVGTQRTTQGGYEYTQVPVGSAALLGTATGAGSASFLWTPPPASYLPTQFVFDNRLTA